MASVRCFVGIPLPDAVVEALVAACDRLKAEDQAWRDDKWVPRSNIHITLHFLGGIDDSALPSLMSAFDDTLRFERFDMPLAGIRPVPSARRSRMVWAEFLDPDGACQQLAETVQRVALPFGVPIEERTFRPHATLARARRPKPLEQRAIEAANNATELRDLSVSVGRVTLFSSRLSPRGPVYTALRDWHARGE